MKKFINSRIKEEADFIEVFAGTKKFQNFYIHSYNLDTLVEKNIKNVRDENGSLRNGITGNINEYIKNNLYEKNKRIKIKINETIIFSSIKQDKVLGEEEFEKALINIYVHNINYFFEIPNMNNKTISDIQNSELIKDKTNYFKYIKKHEENIILNELSRLSHQFLDNQEQKEKFMGKSIKPKNKRCYEDIFNNNKKFLLNNLDYIAQKRYIDYIIDNSCIKLNEAFEQNLNNIINNLLGKEEIKETINKCFYDKYAQFEKKVEKFDSKIKVNDLIEEDDDYSS